MLPLNELISNFLFSNGAQLVRFVDVSHLNKRQTQGYKSAVLILIPLSPVYVQEVSSNPDYVKDMLRTKQMNQDRFHLTEKSVDNLADILATYLMDLGYEAYSQSEKNLEESQRYNLQELRTPLPHKTIALLAGLGWIGKHNLLVHPEYGSALCMCSVLTNAALETEKHEIIFSKCGQCNECVKVCVPKALKGIIWNQQLDRNDLLNFENCTTCLQCMMACPWTQKFASTHTL
nr:hypothetical protein [uncultured Carboxylicivirga sp.]